MVDPPPEADVTPAAASPPETAAPVQPRRRRRRLVLLLLLACVVLIAAAPYGVGRYLESQGVRIVGTNGGPFVVTVEQVSLGWLSPIRLRGVRLSDGQGESLLQARSILSERSLATLAANLRRPGRIIVNEPTVHVIVRPDGSNLEDLLLTLTDGESSRSHLGDIGVTITQGTVSFRTADGRPLLTVADIQCAAAQRVAVERTIQFDWQSVVEDGAQPRPIAAAATWTGSPGDLPFLSGVGTLAIKFAPLPLQPLEHLVTRLLPGTTIHGGSLDGQLLVETDLRTAQTINATGTLVSRNLEVTQTSPDGPATRYHWPEEQFAFKLDGRYDPSTGGVALTEVSLESTPCLVQATGQVTDLAGESVVAIDGQLRYDIQRYLDSLGAPHRQHIQVSGLQTRQFALRGPLARVVDRVPHWDLSRLSLEADVSWETALVYGLRSDQATVVTKLQDGVLHIDPLNVPVGAGKFLASADFMQTDDGPTAVLAAGPALDNMAFSEELCRLWLKFLSPILADATRVTGHFSIDLAGGRFPVNRWEAGEVSGVLRVQAAEVRPGPFADGIAGIISTIRSLNPGNNARSGPLSAQGLVVTLEAQQVPFRMLDGRVHHERLEFVVAGTRVQTSGSVGVADESLDLLIEISLPESWFKDALRGAGTGPDVLQIPVRGTLDRPQFDLAVLRELTRQLATGAAGGLLKKLLD